MEIIDLPQAVLPAVGVTWTMDSNHGYQSSPFSGVGQVQRGQLERWRMALTFRSADREQAAAMQAFFLQLEANANVFRCYDPAAPRPLGNVYGEVTLTADHLAGANKITVAGLPPRMPLAFRAGDWVQIGQQLTKLKRDVDTAADGTAMLEIWPKLHAPALTGAAVVYSRPLGIFRFLSEPPEWEVRAGARRAWSFSLTGVQEVITDTHPLFTA